MSLKIVIPSHKRHDRVISKRLVEDPIICVAESQKELYQKFNPECEIVTHPDDVIGLIPKRNWMARYFGDLFMIDDDVTRFVRLFIDLGEKAVIKDKHHITRLINELYEMACMMDVNLFGFNNATTPTMFKGDRWMSLSHTITGCAYGVRRSPNIWWDEAFEEFGDGDASKLLESPESCDVTIRCYLLSEMLNEALDELETEDDDDEEDEL